MYVKKLVHKKKPITRGKLSITVSQKNFDRLEENSINKSKFINWLLENYYGLNLEGGEK